MIAKALSGHTARSLAIDHGHTKIVSLIDNHILAPSIPLRSDAGLQLGGDSISSEDGALRHKRFGPHGRRLLYKGIEMICQSVVGWVCGRVGCVVGWVCGRVGVWQGGCVVGWVCGRVGVW